MERLTAEDQVLLWPDEAWPQEIGALAVLDGGVLLDPVGRFRIEDVRAAIAVRLHLVPRFRQLLYVPRRGLGGPLWVDAPSFDLADHVRAARVPVPADEAALLRATEQLRRRRLDQSRPLWEVWFLTGLPENRIGLFVKMHHVIADGLAGVATIGTFLDAAPDTPQEAGQPWTPAPWPNVPSWAPASRVEPRDPAEPGAPRSGSESVTLLDTGGQPHRESASPSTWTESGQTSCEQSLSSHPPTEPSCSSEARGIADTAPRDLVGTFGPCGRGCRAEDQA